MIITAGLPASSSKGHKDSLQFVRGFHLSYPSKLQIIIHKKIRCYIGPIRHNTVYQVITNLVAGLREPCEKHSECL